MAPLGRSAIVALVTTLLGGLGTAVHAAGPVQPFPGMVITQSTTFAPGTYSFPSGQGITIAADGITVDGGGAVLTGPGVAGTPSSYAGTGVTASGRSGVTIGNLSVRGFDAGLSVSGGSSWTIQNLDLSGNYDDPSAQWLNGPSFGGLLLSGVSQSTVTNVTALSDWDGLMLHGSSGNTITGNHVNHCSDVCLWMWQSSSNLVQGNDFSYGVRCLTQDAACDSASALIQNHSDANRFLSNDFTHGGDGVFVRTLNGVISTGNLFQDNDGSWAHNNAFESASPGNTFVHNTANHSSFGFWLGLSDHTVLVNNEAGFNGVENAHGPQPWGNGGVSVVLGGSSSFVVQGNYLHDNHNVGLGFGNQIGDEAWHWIVQQNRIVNNATYGIYAYDARWIVFAGNQLSGNGTADVQLGADVSGVVDQTAALADAPPAARATISRTTVAPGDTVTFDASGSTDPSGLPLTYHWELGDGATADTAQVSHSYVQPGFHRVGVDVSDGRLDGLAWFDVSVGEGATEMGTEGTAASAWQASAPGGTATVSVDATRAMAGQQSVRVDASASATIQYPASGTARWNLQGTAQVTLWVRSEHPDLFGFSGSNPTIRLLTDAGDYLQLTPHSDRLDPWQVPYSEARYDWQRLAVPYTGNHDWTASQVGSFNLANVNAVQVLVSSGGGVYSLWLDDLTFQPAAPVTAWQPNVAANAARTGTPAPSASFTTTQDALWAPIDGSPTLAWTDAGSGHAQDWYAVDLGQARAFDLVTLRLATGSGLAPPSKVQVQYWTSGGAWAAAPNASQTAGGGSVSVALATPVQSSRVRVLLNNPDPTHGVYSGIAALAVQDRLNVAGNSQGGGAGLGSPQPQASSNGGAAFAPLDGSLSGSWSPDPAAGGQSWYALDLGQPRTFDRVNLYLASGAGLAPPASIQVQQFDGSQWQPVADPSWQPGTLQPGLNELSFDTVRSRAVRLLLTAAAGTVPGIAELEVAMGNLVQLDPVVTPSASYTSPYDTLWGPIDGTYGSTPRWTCWNSMNATDWYAVAFSRPTLFDRLNLFFYNDGGGVQAPVSYLVQYWTGSAWKNVGHQAATPATPAAGFNAVTFDPVTATQVRVVLTNQSPVNFGVYTGLVELEVLLL
jgi:parallel beta-helix repeat protein